MGLSAYSKKEMEKKETEYYETVPKEVWEDLGYEIARCNLEYADNYRAYKYEDKYGQRIFEFTERNGCCGSFQSHTVIDGVKWIIGCNHGH